MSSQPGKYAYDTEHDRLGVVMAQLGRQIYLRPIGGGREWTTGQTRVRPATAEEVRAARNGGIQPPPMPVQQIKVHVEPCTRPCDICKGAGRQ
jgi:hypothetical protein